MLVTFMSVIMFIRKKIKILHNNGISSFDEKVNNCLIYVCIHVLKYYFNISHHNGKIPLTKRQVFIIVMSLFMY